EVGGMMPQGRRHVLGEQGEGDPPRRQRGRPPGLRRRPRGLQEDPGGIGGRLSPAVVEWNGRGLHGPERGGVMMDSKKSGDGRKAVTLLRPGAGPEEFHLPADATLADLLREARARTDDLDIFIDSRRIEEGLILQPGATVTVVPRARDAG